MRSKTPKGKLLIIGGAEDKGKGEEPDIFKRNRDYEHQEILRQLVPANKKKTIEIVTTASSAPDEVSKSYKKAFERMGVKSVAFMNMGNNYDGKNPRFIARIKKAHAVLFSGGDQFRLSTIMGNTDVLAAIHDRYMNDKDFIVAGTSAGAAAAGTLMMYEGENNEAMLKGAVKISSGLGLINGCLIDTHFIKRGRFGRLAEAIIMNPACIGVGLGEDTALMIEKGNIAKCLGSGMVVIIDGKEVGHTNIAYAKDDTPLCIENLKVHLLCRGCGFKFKEREFLASPDNLKIEKRLKS
ncbi:MAG: cyanophycinase [Bacteroidetes bacterium]|jgi:cyanophycinase|nr:cyanophycinase [Bacteroidota bacterium]